MSTRPAICTGFDCRLYKLPYRCFYLRVVVSLTAMRPFVSHITVFLSNPSEIDRRACDQRVREALQLPDLDIPLSLMRKLPSFFRCGNNVSCAVAETGRSLRLVDIGTNRSFSVALDIGTTNLAALLYDNVEQKDLAALTLENPQIAFGSDILTRMQSTTAGSGEHVYKALIDGVNNIIDSLCKTAGVNRGSIHAVAAAGNTAMTHYFLGLDISTIPVSPWAPVVHKPGFLKAADIGIDICPEALVYTFPNAGSYVGGDITAGIIATGMHRQESISILIDVGTNAEVAIGNKEWLIVGAGAAGPALEEGVSRIGKRAKKDIIYDVEIENEKIRCKTFDNGLPEGICGSGMVSLLFEMYKAGIIDQSGTLTDHNAVQNTEGEKYFVLSCNKDSRLVITQAEIHNFMSSKAAMFTLLLTLTRSVGISFEDVGTVFVSGALGTGIDAEKAAGIGMIPAWPAEKVQAKGNTSLAGCRMLLADSSIAAEADDLVERITYKHMHDDPEFMKEFPGAVFLPHTNPEVLKAG